MTVLSGMRETDEKKMASGLKSTVRDELLSLYFGLDVNCRFEAKIPHFPAVGVGVACQLLGVHL